MFSRLLMPITLALSCLIINCPAQNPDSSPGVEVTAINDNFFRLTCSANDIHAAVLAFTGEDGILLIDAGHTATAQTLADSLRALNAGEVKYVLNTHSHLDHCGGNSVFAPEADIIAQENSVKYFSGSYFHLPGEAIPGAPNVTFTDSLVMNFNGEEILMLYPGYKAHTDGDAVVYFKNAKIIHFGDLIFTRGYPFVDVYNKNGDVEGYAKFMQEMIGFLPENIRIVSSHGPDFTLEDLRRYHLRIAEMIEIVRQGMNNGKSLEQLRQEEVFKKYDMMEWYLIEAADWMRDIYTSLDRKINPPPLSVCEPLTKTLVESGIDSLAAVYHRLKTEKPDGYDYTENQLNFLGYQLIQRNMLKEALVVFKLNVEAYPESFNPYDSLAEACRMNGDKEQAIVNYEKSLELNPENTNAVRQLKTLRNE